VQVRDVGTFFLPIKAVMDPNLFKEECVAQHGWLPDLPAKYTKNRFQSDMKPWIENAEIVREGIHSRDEIEVFNAIQASKSVGRMGPNGCMWTDGGILIKTRTLVSFMNTSGSKLTSPELVNILEGTFQGVLFTREDEGSLGDVWYINEEILESHMD